MSMPDIRSLVPHSGRMVLLDRVVAADADTLTAELTIRADHPFVDDDGVGAWVGIEFMAQTIAAFAGHDAMLDGRPPKVGFLLGTRSYDCNAPSFPVGTTLRVTVRRELHGENGGLGSFSCTISGAGIEANAMLAVFQPDSTEGFLTGQDG